MDYVYYVDMAVPSVFLSSVIRGYEDVRDAAAAGVERVGMHPIRSERLAAEASSPRRALLDEVADADLYMLLLGERYGEATGERAPTEDEFDEAVRRHKPILVLVQEGGLEAAQQAFLERIRGSWGDGVFYGRFRGPEDVGAAVAAALGRHQAGIIEDGPAAQARAIELASGEARPGTTSSGVAARCALVPLRQLVLLDPVTLDEAHLGDDLAGLLRAADLVPQRIGLAAHVSGAGVRVEGSDVDNWTRPEAVITADGAIVVVGSVAVEGTMGFSLVDPGKLEALVRRAGRFAQLVWDRLDARGEISRVAVAAAIPESQHKGFGAVSGNSMSMSMSLPPVVVSDPAEIVARGQLADQEPARRVLAAIKRVFADAGAVQE